MKCVALCVCLTTAELAACAYLPTAGPTAGEVIDQGLQDNRIRYDVVDINRGVVDALLAQPAESFRTRFGKYSRPTPPRIGIGDTISITIWEAAGGGLFGTSPIAGVSPGSRSVAIPEQVVGADGGVSVPFAGRIPVADRSTVDVQRGIEQRLAEKAIEPQVIVTITKSVTYAATVSGEVVNGARVPLSVKGDRLLDLIALAGGAKSAVYDTFVRLSRDKVTVTIPMERLVSDPGENILRSRAMFSLWSACRKPIQCLAPPGRTRRSPSTPSGLLWPRRLPRLEDCRTCVRILRGCFSSASSPRPS